MRDTSSRPGVSRRVFLVGGGLLAIVGAAVFALRRRLVARLSRWTRVPEFEATPPLVPHDERRDRTTLYVSSGKSPADNVDAVIDKLGGMGAVVGKDDVVLIKVSAQWWNQGMTNVAAVKRTIERTLETPGFSGEVVVFENTHFRLKDGSGLSRAWSHPSERNVDVPGWNKLGDLVEHFASQSVPVSFVGLVDAVPSELADDDWHDPRREHGVYGGDGRGPIERGDRRDGYRWDLDQAFRLRRSWVDHAQTPLSWPVLISPRTGLVIDLRAGVFERKGERLAKVERKLTWINMTTANEHSATGFTGCCKSAMGVVDMSAGRFGLDERIRDYQSVHFFGSPAAPWRMAGPLAHFAKQVRAPDLYLTVAEWVGATPAAGWNRDADIRLDASSAVRTRTVVAGRDPVAVDTWCVRHLLMPVAGAEARVYDLDDENSTVVKFLRYYRQVYGLGTMDLDLVEVV